MPDLHVDDEIAVLNPETRGSKEIDPYDESTFDDLWIKEKLPRRIYHMESALLSTREVVHVPIAYVANIHLRSTFARLGLICPSTTTDPGFIGTLTLEVFNNSGRPFLIRPGDSLFHYILNTQEGEPPYNGRYQNQRGITFPRALPPKRVYEGCHSGRDGDCAWSECPQIRDGEPHKSGRHCPLDRVSDDV